MLHLPALAVGFSGRRAHEPHQHAASIILKCARATLQLHTDSQQAWLELLRIQASLDQPFCQAQDSAGSLCRGLAWESLRSLFYLLTFVISSWSRTSRPCETSECAFFSSLTHGPRDKSCWSALLLHHPSTTTFLAPAKSHPREQLNHPVNLQRLVSSDDHSWRQLI